MFFLLNYMFSKFATNNSSKNFYIVTSGLFAILLVYVSWRYWKMIRKYSHFPSRSMLLYPLYFYVSQKIPKNIPPNTYSFHLVTSILEEFRNEGLGLLWFGKPILFVLNEEYIKKLSNAPEALDKPHVYGIFRDVMGTGLITCNGELWKVHRKMYDPAFRLGVLKCHLQTMNEKAENLVKNVSTEASGQPINIIKHLNHCSFHIMFESVLGLKIDNPDTLKLMNDFLKVSDYMIGITVYRIYHPWLYFKFMVNLMPTGRRYLNMYKEVKEIAAKVASHMKESYLRNELMEKNEEEAKSISFSQILISSYLTNPSYTFENLQDEIITFMGAGYDTVSHSMMWCLYLLGHHQDVQELVRNEVESVVDGHVTYAQLSDLKYLESVIMESMRIYPTVPLYGKRNTNDIQCGKYVVPKGTFICFCPYVAHKDPSVYPDPDEFKPERFMENNPGKRSPIYTPFAQGLRSCIGKKFAMMEMKVVLSHILRNFYITSLDKKEDIHLYWKVLLTTSKPLKFIFTPRKKLNTSN